MALAVLLAVQALAADRVLRLPARRPEAVGGVQFAREISGLAQREREERVWREVSSGNVPNFLRRLAPVPLEATVEGKVVTARIFVTPDYLGGSGRTRITCSCR